VYGLKDAALEWYKSLLEIIKELGGLKSKLDPSIFYWKEECESIGILCVHVDDIMYGGNKTFLSNIVKNLKRIKIGETNETNMIYLGVEINQKGEEIKLNQRKFIRKLEEDRYDRKGNAEEDLKEEEMTTYRSGVGKLNWLVQQTRPDIAFETSILSTKNKQVKYKDLKKLKKTIRNIKEKDVEIIMRKLNDETEIEIYTDASFGNVENGKTQIGYIISLKDKKNEHKCIIQ